MVQEQMQFNGLLRSTKFRPVKQGDRQIDDRRIDTDPFIFKPELFLSRHWAPAALEQLEKDPLLKFPGTVLIGISQGGMTGSGDSRVFQFALTAPQPAANFSERMSSPQLAEKHGHKLTLASKSPGMTLGFRLFDRLLKFDPGKEL